VSALTPNSSCPHGVTIEPDWVCGVCHGAAPPTQLLIDKMPTPPPINPEVRIVNQITHLSAWLEAHPHAAHLIRLGIRRRIIELNFEYTKWIATRYVPRANLKGGLS
jgi:hypothetical protein